MLGCSNISSSANAPRIFLLSKQLLAVYELPLSDLEQQTETSKESHISREKKNTNKLQDCYILATAHLPISKASSPS